MHRSRSILPGYGRGSVSFATATASDLTIMRPRPISARRLRAFREVVSWNGKTPEIPGLRRVTDESASYAFSTLPLLMQVVQTRRRLAPPFTFAFTGRRLTFQRRLVMLCACEMLLP